METVDILNKEFFTQDFTGINTHGEILNRCKLAALNYAQTENAVAVLSDLRKDVSYIYYGGFSRTLGIGGDTREEKLSSIWEKGIFKLVHPDDLAGKHMQELFFYHFIKRQNKKKRAEYYLMSKLRMKTGTGDYIRVLHRMFYIHAPHDGTLLMALCLYTPLLFDIPVKCAIVNSVNGQTSEPDRHDSGKILSAREKQVLSFIDKGFTSKKIAELLSISINTVNRHRQEILNKLRVRNSIEACNMAKDLNLI